MLSLLNTVLALFAPPTGGPGRFVFQREDTPDSQMVRLGGPYALVKKNAGSPAELVGPFNVPLWFCGVWPAHWSVLNGQETSLISASADRSAVSGRWFVSQSLNGRYGAVNLASGDDFAADQPSLDAVNSLLAKDGLPPLTDADLRTFEEHVAERERRKLALSGGGLAGIAVGWAVVVGVLVVRRRR